jgi:Helix-turn-helix domain
MSHADESVDEEAPTQVFARPAARSPARASVLNPDALWDANDVARYLKVSRSWVYHRAETGLLACTRIGGLLRFDPLNVRALARGGGDPHTGAGLSDSGPGKNR